MVDELLLCPQCHTPVQPTWPYCTHCGWRLNPSPSPAYTVPVCDNCGANIDSSGAFCWKCGVPLSTGRAPFIPAHPPAPGDEPPAYGPRVGFVSSATMPTPGATPRPSIGRPPRRPLPLGALLVILGIVVLVISLFVGWYGISATLDNTAQGSNLGISLTFFPLNQYSESVSCSGSSSCPPPTTVTGSYSQGTFDSVATLYDAVAALVIGSIVLGGAGAGLAMVSRKRRPRAATVFVVLALILAATAPLLALAEQPSALSSQGTPSGGASPSSSFFGSCSGSACGSAVAGGETVSASWGPGVGWYLALVAIVPLFVGLLYLARGRPKDLPPTLY